MTTTAHVGHSLHTPMFACGENLVWQKQMNKQWRVILFKKVSVKENVIVMSFQCHFSPALSNDHFRGKQLLVGSISPAPSTQV